MPSKELIVDFYELVLTPASSGFEKLLKPWMESSTLKIRTKSINGKYVRLAEATFGEKSVEGDFSKIRMDNLPDKGSPNRADQPLGLSDDEGLSTGRAFFYYVPMQVVLLQRNRNGASNTEIESYLQQVLGLTGVELRPILQVDAYKRLQSMEELKTLDIKVAGLTNAAAFKNDGNDLGKLVELLQFFQAPNAHIRVSVGRKKSSLLPSLKGLAEKLAKLAGGRPEAIKKVELSGLDGLGRNQVVDLLLDRLHARTVVEFDGRRLPYASRRTGVYNAFLEAANELKTIRSETKTEQ